MKKSDLNYTESYRSKKYSAGEKFESNFHGKYIILGKATENNNKSDKFIVSFPTGGICTATTGHITRGEVKDPMAKTLFGVGMVGNIKKYDKRTYAVWKGMIERCYSEKWLIKKPLYKGTTVYDRWHVFENFRNDLPNIDGYDAWINGEKVELDKDLKQQNVINKVYSLDTVAFVSAEINNKEKYSRRNYLAINDELGIKEKFIIQREFATKYNLNFRSISRVLSGERKQYHGWKFEEILAAISDCC